MGSDKFNPHCLRITMDVYWTHIQKLCNAADKLHLPPETILENLIDYGGDIALKCKDERDLLTKLGKLAGRE